MFRAAQQKPLLATCRDYSCDVMSDNDYNGWSNRATWNVNLWLGNDENTYLLMSSLKRVSHFQFENFCHYVWNGKTPDGISLDGVDWEEIADAWRYDEDCDGE